MIVAATAILISLISLGVAYKHGVIMERLVAANSWPLLQYTTGNFNEETSTPDVSLSIENVGVGPAVIKQFTMYLDGRSYSQPGALVTGCCSPKNARDLHNQLYTNPVSGTVIKAGETTRAIVLKRTPQALASWQKLNAARFKVTFDVCYCSVFNDCWRSDLTGVDPKPVDSCPYEPDPLIARNAKKDS
jgi:hypothetical protein